MVCDLLLGLGRQWTVEFTSLGTLTMFPWIDNWPTLDSSRSCIKGIRGDISHSSSDVKFNTLGLQGKPILLALEQMGNLPCFRPFVLQVRQLLFQTFFILFLLQDLQIHSVSLTLLKPIRQDSTMSSEHTLYLFGSHFATEHLNHNWSQQVHTYSGPHAMFFVKQIYHRNCIVLVFLWLQLTTATC